MPTYQYTCKNCGQHLEVVQSFTDDALTVCPSCEGPLRKVWGSVGVVFKGSGFYRNDSRGGTSSSLAAKESHSNSSDSSPSSSSSSESSAKSTPAASGASTSAS